MKICFFPIESKDNDYVNNMISMIKQLGIEVYSTEDVKRDFKLFMSVHIFHFNWYENLGTKNYYKALYILLKKVCTIFLLKMFNKKIIWTMHNKIAHDSVDDKLSMFILKFIAKQSNKIVIHSKESINILNNIIDKKKITDKIVYIHHINYINNINLNNNLIKFNFKINDNELIFMFCGAVKKYKNIELLIKAFNDLELKNCKLIIAGKPYINDYKREINKIINGNKNIITIFKFLSNNELFSLINLSDILIFPYNKKSSLNSGSIILGFSCKKTVISPMIGTLLDMKDQDFYYGYDYQSEEEHYNKLKQYILKVYNDYSFNKKILKEKGEQAFTYINNYYNSDVVKKELDELYNNY